MTNYAWSLGFSHGEKRVEFRWSEYFYKGESLGYAGFLINPDSGETFREFDEFLSESALRAAVTSFRQGQLRSELPRGKFGELEPRSVILEIFERAQAGEFVGQGSYSAVLYVQDLAALLERSFQDVLAVVDELIEQGLLGLNGMILITNESFEETYAHLLASTGHKRLSVSDFGYWACGACGKRGDDYENPADVPCV